MSVQARAHARVSESLSLSLSLCVRCFADTCQSANTLKTSFCKKVVEALCVCVVVWLFVCMWHLSESRKERGSRQLLIGFKVEGFC